MCVRKYKYIENEMTNTDKLLRAFIEASGYEIEEIESVDSIPCNGGFRAGGDIIDYKVTKKSITKERRKFLTDNNMLFTLAIEEGNEKD